MITTYTLTTNDAEKWRAVLPANRRVTGSVEYMRICEEQAGHEARLFVVEDGVPLVAYPYFQRPVGAVPFAGAGTEAWADTFTPEYCGPVALNGGLSPASMGQSFPELFARHCEEQGIIAEFAHLNPWDVPADLLVPGCAQVDREIVYVDLTQSAEDIWAKSLSQDGRRLYKQGLKAGVVARYATTPDDVREFHRIYEMTMKRRRAGQRYFFPLEYFMAFFETLPAHSYFVLAEHEGGCVAGGLYLQDETNVQWHLSASDMEFSHLRAVNVYHYEAILTSLGQGRERLIMGGGFREGDGLLRFKAAFSPLRAEFRTYRRIHNPAAYAALEREWSAHHGGAVPGDGFFPAYRSEGPQTGTAENQAVEYAGCLQRTNEREPDKPTPANA